MQGTTINGTPHLFLSHRTQNLFRSFSHLPNQHKKWGIIVHIIVVIQLIMSYPVASVYAPVIVEIFMYYLVLLKFLAKICSTSNLVVCCCPLTLVSEPDPRKNRKEGLGWGGSVHCAQNAGALPIDSWLHANARLLEIENKRLLEIENKRAGVVIGALISSLLGPRTSSSRNKVGAN